MTIYINHFDSLSAIGRISTGIPDSNSIPTIVDYNLDYLGKQTCPVAKINSEFLISPDSLPKAYEKSDSIVRLACSLKLDSEYASGRTGIFIGSSRAATGIFEDTFQTFIEGKRIPIVTSPLTTHANVASALASKLELDAFSIEHSVTCSSGLFSIIDSIAWLKSDMLDSAIAGGVEASLTDFTVAQMLALKIYTSNKSFPYSCPFEQNQKQNSFVLGEGAALFQLSRHQIVQERRPIKIYAYATAYENTKSLVSISKQADALTKSMQTAVKMAGLKPDLILAHAPGTIVGDQAEALAIKKLFAEELPYIYSSKLLFGHSLGASGPLSLALACNILETQVLPVFPYSSIWGEQSLIGEVKTILINATGFGGTAVSIIVGL